MTWLTLVLVLAHRVPQLPQPILAEELVVDLSVAEGRHRVQLVAHMPARTSSG